VFTGRSVHDNVTIGLHLRSRQTPLAILLGLPSVAREERELAREAAEILRFVGLEARAGQLASRCPTASCGSWRSPSRSPPARSSFFSTSRYRA